MILLDTHALLWLHTGHKRTKALRGKAGLYVSPATVLELCFLVEIGRVTLRGSASVDDLVDDDRWLVDDPPSAAWFALAGAEAWTRDPFDRLLVAHARLRNWRLATADEHVLERLGRLGVVEL